MEPTSNNTNATVRYPRRRLRRSSPSMRVLKSLPLALALVAASASIDGAHAAVCSQSQMTDVASITTNNKAIFQSCISDLKLPASSEVTSFVSSTYLQDTQADAICASSNCVKALIAAMENLPDCCSQTGGGQTVNLPRLADDILHQCDIRDARVLAKELEKEIAKLPDLKVQIKSDGTNDSSTGVDVIIDVKKRELMKLGRGLNGTETNVLGTTASSDARTVSLSLAAVAWTAVQVWWSM